MRKLSLRGTTLVLFTLITTLAWAQSPVKYTLSMPEPHTHYFEVEMVVEAGRDRTLDFTMPVWAPGSYLVREFSKSVEDFEATDASGKALPFLKVDKNTWRVSEVRNQQVTVSYRVYAYEMSVRTSFLDASHGYLNGTSIFMYVNGRKAAPVQLTINPYQDWEVISTALKMQGNVYTAPDYTVFVDAPIEIGNHKVYSFEAAGVPHKVAMYGWGNYDEASLMDQMARVVEACTDVFGENPNEDYLFIVHNLTRGSGGLEHLNSTTLQVNRWSYGPNRINGFLGLVAHEYFHLWNVKRIRPEALGPFDYENENYTYHLWVMEGFTSYYDELLLQRAGIFSEDEYINKLIGTINRVEQQPGSAVQPVAMASFDAWIKAYRPNENSYNTTISYYSKGSVLAAMLDLMIIHHTEGERSLDDVMKKLYFDIYKAKGRGFTDDELITIIESVAGIELDDWFEQHIFGSTPPDYETIFGYAGLDFINTNPGTDVFLGAYASSDGGNLNISRVTRGSSAYAGGLNVNDEILAVDGMRVSSMDDIQDMVGLKSVGDEVSFLISRDNLIQTITFELLADERPSYTVQLMDNATEAQRKVLRTWMRSGN